ncbi:hypothetical protein IEQ34_026503 [Dendrobium chrysotoxum]|uniref:RRM domain-containing protein n=1 Tax=Dendrobium chrysotoxum TaxID=161865 RepID=A0AAV7FM00_DENCH|nr:hypothetical protein IEQ34_026503 [Dendrobium chrysotoxum]
MATCDGQQQLVVGCGVGRLAVEVGGGGGQQWTVMDSGRTKVGYPHSLLMGRNRSRSRSYSPRRNSRSPPRRKRYDDPRDRYRGGSSRGFRDRRGPPSGLLIRNISLDARPEDLRIPFERFGPVKDVYLPKNYYTGFVVFFNIFKLNL